MTNRSQPLQNPEFGELPPSQTGRSGGSSRSQWEPLADQLRATPGQWARLGTTQHSSLSTSIKRGKYGFTPPGAFDAALRQHTDTTTTARTFDLWACYLGAPAD